MNLMSQFRLKMNFFVKPFLFNEPYEKDMYWKAVLTDYMYNASFQTLPFSFEGLLRLPLYMIDEVYTIQKDIIEQRKKQYESAI